LRRDTLIVGRTVGPVLTPIGDRRFRIGTSVASMEFLPNGDLVQTISAWPNPKPITMKRFEIAKPTKADLAAYAGTYVSDELGATYTVTATDSTLVLKTRWAVDRIVRPAYEDTFTGDFLVSFTRGRGRKIEGMQLSTGRVRRVSFVRAAPR
jgi:hypothetical protein